MSDGLESISTRVIPAVSGSVGVAPDANSKGRDFGAGGKTGAAGGAAHAADNAPNSGADKNAASAPSAAASGASSRANNTSDSDVGSDSLNLSPEAQQQLRGLQQRDAEVRSHEQAHIAAAGPYAVGGPSYTYQKGPDGRQYAIGGHVDIDVSSVPGNPQATKEKAQQIRRAALAPGEPSAQDQQVAAEAGAMDADAQSDIQRKEQKTNPQRQRAAGMYGAMDMRFTMPTALAPYGTGFSITV